MTVMPTISALLPLGITKEGQHPQTEARQTELRLLFIILRRNYVFHPGSKPLSKSLSVPSLSAFPPPSSPYPSTFPSLSSNLYLLLFALHVPTHHTFIYTSSPPTTIHLHIFHPPFSAFHLPPCTSPSSTHTPNHSLVDIITTVG